MLRKVTQYAQARRQQTESDIKPASRNWGRGVNGVPGGAGR